MPVSKALKVVDWILRIVVAVILFQTLFFKFSAARESVYIFSTLGVEPWGRLAAGVVELIAALLLVVPRTVAFGSILSLGTISGALMAHVTMLGIKLTAVGDHGELFGLALIVFVLSLVLLVIHRSELPVIGPRLVSASSASLRLKSGSNS